MRHRVEKTLVLEFSEDETRLLESIMLKIKNKVIADNVTSTPSSYELEQLKLIDTMRDIIKLGGM